MHQSLITGQRVCRVAVCASSLSCRVCVSSVRVCVFARANRRHHLRARARAHGNLVRACTCECVLAGMQMSGGAGDDGNARAPDRSHRVAAVGSRAAVLSCRRNGPGPATLRNRKRITKCHRASARARATARYKLLLMAHGWGAGVDRIGKCV